MTWAGFRIRSKTELQNFKSDYYIKKKKFTDKKLVFYQKKKKYLKKMLFGSALVLPIKGKNVHP